MKALKVAYFNKRNHWLANAEKTYTPGGNIKSHGYGRVINWISEIWQDIHHNRIPRSFDPSGITTTNVTDYSNQFRNFVRNNQFVENIEPIDAAISYLLFWLFKFFFNY
jgi:hypothetical protein